MKRIVTQWLVAAGLAAGACGVAQAHTDLSLGLSLGAPAPAYVEPAPAYGAPAPVYYRHDDRGYGWRRHESYRDDHRWDHRDDGRRGGNDGHGWRG
jgi:hypothetical protein